MIIFLRGVSSFRFDQYGCGNSEGDFENSTFSNWVDTTITLVNKYYKRGYQVSLFGQSMGGACVIIAGSKLGNKVSSIATWSPGIIKDSPKIKGKYMYEKGQRVKWKYWVDAHKANIPESFKKLGMNTYVFFPTEDEYVPYKDQQVIIKSAKAHQKIEILKDQLHSQWPYDVSQKVIEKTADFLASNFKK